MKFNKLVNVVILNQPWFSSEKVVLGFTIHRHVKFGVLVHSSTASKDLLCYFVGFI